MDYWKQVWHHMKAPEFLAGIVKAVIITAATVGARHYLKKTLPKNE